ncbi:hypothetical protein Nepgr_023226 [Nepenthes gracilis]|uniref:SPARK domain-containing protein n=1 Tax=Nepenthes gracilis TaxID=150966 RepID=A0AAD3T2F9_NEPGR|nr:hypothetical protein Nepgr_023226 [Nepenthes gracilis]
MSQHPSAQLQSIISFSLLFSLLLVPLPTATLDALPDPVPDPVQQQNFFPTTPQSPPATTVASFPEQSALSGCPLNLPDELFGAVKASCTAGEDGSGQLHRSQCCPVLGAWLYWAYSDTALDREVGPGQITSYEMMPVLPDDSELCVDSVERAMREKGIELGKANETCDVVYCYCGIRLHALSCPASFYVSEQGKVAGDERVERLERDCLNGNASRAACSKCLKSLYQLKSGKMGSSGKSVDRRTSKMRSRDCELMGLTWLLAKNRTAYIATVTAVLRAMMMSSDGSDPSSCSLNSDGMPLAVDSSEISIQSSAPTFGSDFYLILFLLCLLYIRQQSCNLAL